MKLLPEEITDFFLSFKYFFNSYLSFNNLIKTEEKPHCKMNSNDFFSRRAIIKREDKTVRLILKPLGKGWTLELN